MSADPRPAWPPRHDAEGREHAPRIDAYGSVAYQFCATCFQVWPCPTARPLPERVAVLLLNHHRREETT